MSTKFVKVRQWILSGVTICLAVAGNAFAGGDTLNRVIVTCYSGGTLQNFQPPAYGTVNCDQAQSFSVTLYRNSESSPSTFSLIAPGGTQNDKSSTFDTTATWANQTAFGQWSARVDADSWFTWTIAQKAPSATLDRVLVTCYSGGILQDFQPTSEGTVSCDSGQGFSVTLYRKTAGTGTSTYSVVPAGCAQSDQSTSSNTAVWANQTLFGQWSAKVDADSWFTWTIAQRGFTVDRVLVSCYNGGTLQDFQPDLGGTVFCDSGQSFSVTIYRKPIGTAASTYSVVPAGGSQSDRSTSSNTAAWTGQAAFGLWSAKVDNGAWLNWTIAQNLLSTLTVVVNNVAGGLQTIPLAGSGQVCLYDKNGTSKGCLTTDTADRQVRFSGLDASLSPYSYGVTNAGAFSQTEYWGRQNNINLTVSQITQDTFTRNMAYVSKVQFYDTTANPNQEVFSTAQVAAGHTMKAVLSVAIPAAGEPGWISATFKLDKERNGTEDVSVSCPQQYISAGDTGTLNCDLGALASGGYSYGLILKWGTQTTATAAWTQTFAAGGGVIGGGSDTTAPAGVQVTAPAPAQVFSGTFTLKATAQDDSGTIQKMEFYVDSDSTPACTDAIAKSSGSVFQCSWGTTAKSNGGHYVVAKAYDPSGNSASSGGVSFLVSNTLNQTLHFIPVTPCRVTDTRNGNGVFGGPIMPGGSTRDFPIPVSSCGIPSWAQAYSLNVTVVPPGPMAYLSIWPTGQPQPLVSTLNSFEGRVVANAAIVPAGANGSISVFVSNTTDVIIDINGYFVPPGAGALAFYPVTPCRVADTRNPTGTLGGPTMPGGSTRNFPIPQSSCAIPSSARAYSLNMTVVPQGALAYLSTWPTGQPLPLVSTLNSFDGKVVANATIVPAGADGSVGVYVTNTTDVVIDINGYFAPPGGAGALSFYTAMPCRVADTRNSTGTFGGPAMPGDSSRVFPVPQSSCGIPSSAQVYSLNVTVVPAGPLFYLTTWSTGQPKPLVSTLNSFDGRTVANAAIVPAGTSGSTSVYVTGPTGVIIDINGYFAP